MAKINVNDNIEGEIGGAGFTQQGTAIANTLAPDIAVALADTAKGLYVESKKAEAAAESKSLLDEFTGREHTALDEESVVDDPIAESPDVQGPHQTTAATEQIEGLKKQLAHERKAVAQGLMSNDEFRLRAEQSFYQITALTPGIKSEIAAVMGEYLGIDPRGQTAQITMRDRDNAAAADAARNKQLVSALITERLYDPGLSDDENISKNWPIIQQDAMAMKNIEMEMQQIALGNMRTEQDKKTTANNVRTWLPKATRTALNQMGVYEGANIVDFTPQEVIDMTPENRAAWAQSASKKAGEMRQLLNSVESSTGESFAADRDTIDKHLELMLSIINSEQLNDALATNLSVAQTRNNLLVEAATAQIAITQSEVVKLAAYENLGIRTTDLLDVNIKTTQMVLRGLNGDVVNLKSVSPKDKATVINTYTDMVGRVANSYGRDPKSYNAMDVGNAGNVALTVANQHPAVLDSIKPSLQLFKLVAQKDFVPRLEEVDPEKAHALKQGVINHQKHVGSVYNQEIGTILDEANADQLSPLDFHIEKIEDSWVVLPNTDVDARLTPSRIGTPPANQEQMLARKDQQFVDKKKNALITSLNRTPKMISNMVQSRAAATGLPLSEAAKQIAQSMGISTVDGVAPKPGFSGRTTPEPKTAKEEQRENEDFQPITDGERAAPLERLADGTYTINDSLYQIKDGEIIPIE